MQWPYLLLGLSLLVVSISSIFLTYYVWQRQNTSSAVVAQELKHQNLLLEILVAIARVAAEQPVRETTLEYALDVVAHLTGAEQGVLFLTGERSMVTYNMPALERQPPPPTQHHINQTLDTGLTGWVVEHRQAAIIDDTTGDQRWHPWPDVQSDPWRSALAVPIINGTGGNCSGLRYDSS